MTPPRSQKIQIGAKEFVHLNPEKWIAILDSSKKTKIYNAFEAQF